MKNSHAKTINNLSSKIAGPSAAQSQRSNNKPSGPKSLIASSHSLTTTPASRRIISKAKFLFVGALTAGLIATIATPASAFAEARTQSGTTSKNGTASTAVFLEADNSTLSVSAPTEIHVMVKGDGSFITPSAQATQIQNASVFGIHVEKITASSQNSFKLVDQASVGTQENAITYSIQPNSGAAVSLARFEGGANTTGSDWNMTKAGSEGANLNLTTAGSIANITKDLNADQQFATVNWTFQAGLNN